MTRSLVFALVLAALAGVISISSGISARRSREVVETMIARASSVETARPPASIPAPPSDNATLAREVAALRGEVAALSLDTSGGMSKSDEEARARKAWMERMVRAISETIEARLALSPEQKLQVADVLTSLYTALSDPRRAAASREEQKAQAAGLQAEAASQIRELLTPEQRPGFARMIDNPAGIFGIDLIPKAGQLPGEEGSSPH
jgi:hypothetical protein